MINVVKKLQPRPYQQSAAEIAISQNSIINIRTGGGKTLIAVLVINHFLSNSGKKILFIVPSRALVTQQSEYLSKNCFVNSKDSSIIRVTEMCGQEFGTWSRASWSKCLLNTDILVGTAEIFRFAFVDQGFIDPADFSLIVFDECHNAVGNHPMAAILRDAILRATEIERPRILGLTASFVNGSMKNIVEKRSALESLFNAAMFAPKLPETVYKDKSYFKVDVQFEDLTSFRGSVIPIIEAVLSAVTTELGRDYEKWVNRGYALFTEMGLDGLRFWLREGIVTQLNAFCNELKKRQDDVHCRNIAFRLEANLPRIHSILRQKAMSVISSYSTLSTITTLPPPFSQKLIGLLRLLWTLVGESKSTDSIRTPQATSRGIVFVEQVAMTYPLAFVVNKFFMEMKIRRSLSALPVHLQGDIDSDIDAALRNSSGDYSLDALAVEIMLPVSGATSMADHVRVQNLDCFRSGAVPLLVSTNALEEGIDVAECDFIVRFDSFSTTKSHIQGSGRARCESAKIYYFDNDPTKECSKAAEMEEVSRRDEYKLSEDELSDSLKEIQRHGTMGAVGPVQYPFRPSPASGSSTAEGGEQSNGDGVTDAGAGVVVTHKPHGGESSGDTNDSARDQEDCADPSGGGGEVNFFNCLSIFFKYTQRVLKQSFDPDSLFRWRREVVRELPYEERWTLVSVSYPSPTGFCTVSNADVDDFWQGYKVEDVVLPVERYKKLSGQDRDKRRAVYVVVVQLHSLGLLTASNDPSPHALSSCRNACAAMILDNKLNLKNRFASDLLAPTVKTYDVLPISPLIQSSPIYFI